MALLRPIQGEVALKFWSSSNICNRVRAICAYSVDYEDANRNLTRYGYSNSFRKRVLGKAGIVFNNPTMENLPFNEGNTPLDECLDKGPINGRFATWMDALNWDDSQDWVEWIPDPVVSSDDGWKKPHTFKE